MREMINYMIEANVALLLFLVFYRLLLRTETHFRLMRFFMLAAVIFSVILPLIHLNDSQSASIPTIERMVPANWLPEIVISGRGGNYALQNANNAQTVWQIAIGVYVAGVILFLGWLSLQLANFLYQIKKAPYYVDQFKIIESADDKPTFSFFNIIHIGRANELTSLEKRQIIVHESVHARQLHSLDILLITTLQILFWFNPFLRLYKKVFVQLHEFEADARAVENSDVNKYCSLLAKVALQSADLTLASHFNNSLTLKRIHMIRKIKKQLSHWKLAMILVVFPLAFFIISCQDQVNVRQNEAQPEISASNEIFSVVAEMPTFVGGPSDMGSFISGNLVYPKDARQQGIEGVVYTEFVVEKSGELTNFKTLKGIGAGCDEAALNTIKSMPKWNPGVSKNKIVRTKMVLPIKFKLQ